MANEHYTIYIQAILYPCTGRKEKRCHVMRIPEMHHTALSRLKRRCKTSAEDLGRAMWRRCKCITWNFPDRGPKIWAGAMRCTCPKCITWHFPDSSTNAEDMLVTCIIIYIFKTNFVQYPANMFSRGPPKMLVSVMDC